MSHTHQLFTLVFLSLLLCARLHFSDFFRARLSAPQSCPLPVVSSPRKKVYMGVPGGLYVYGFLTAAALRLYICFVALGARISATYQGFIAPFSICFYCKLTYIYSYYGSALPHLYFIFILVFLIIRASILTHYYPHNIPHFSPFLTIYQHYFCVHTK